MTSNKAEAGVKTMRLRPAFIAGQLNQTTIAFTSQQDGLLHEPSTDSLPAQATVNPHGFDIGSQRATTAKSGYEGQLQHRDEPSLQLADQQVLIDIAIYCVESLNITGFATADSFSIFP